MSDTPLPVLHFSDILCVWAYVGQRRVDELRTGFGARIALAFHYLPIYGDVPRRIERSGLGAEGYRRSVASVVERFDHVELHPDAFRVDVPVSSQPAHRYLRAVHALERAEGAAPGAAEALARRVREAFFAAAVDVSRVDRLDALAEAEGLPVAAVHDVLGSGRADAELANDAWLQQQHRVAISPTFVLDGGRNLLTGNVGYRVIRAHVTELLEHPPPEGSWC